jgi:hypothetical protein
MTTAICAAIFLGALGSAARFAQGNGHGGPGRWAVYALCLVASWYGPANATTTLSWSVLWIVWTAACCGWTIGGGYTDWKSIRYGLLRYGLPPLAGILPWLAMRTAADYALVYPVICAVGISFGQLLLVERKPDWMQRLTSSDVGTIPAGFLVVGLLALV